MTARNIIMLGIILALSGCGYINRLTAFAVEYTTICVKETNVQYVQFPTGAAVLVDTNGKPQQCKGE